MKHLLLIPRIVSALFILLSCLPEQARAATYFVASSSSTPPGNNSNAGTASAPWLTVAYAVANMNCGDTLNVVADGNFVAGDATLPSFANCASTTTIQSSALAKFAPAGYRTNPTSDAANYGRLQMSGSGIVSGAEVHGQAYGMPYSCTWTGFSSITIANPGVFTVSCGAGLRIGVDSQVVFEISSNNPFPPVSMPAPLVLGQHYYVVAANFNCVRVIGCAAGSTFSVSATPGGPPIQITACDANCQASITAAAPVGVDTSISVMTAPDNLVNIRNGTPVAFAASGLQSYGVLPDPLELNQIYYVVNSSGQNFQVASTPGGAPLQLTTVGTGLTSVANVNVPHDWAFRGLEFAPLASTVLYGMLQLGQATELSIYGMVHHMEVDRCYFHGNDPASLGGYYDLVRGIGDNGQYVYIHDSYLSGNTLGESQAIQGAQGVGPTVIANNFLESATEITLYGGQNPSAGLANAFHTFLGNYYYKPPFWRLTTGTGAASGPCLYDTTDPLRSGGEWYTDTSVPRYYQCGLDSMWHPASAPPPALANLSFKDEAEHKNGRVFTYFGNIFNYSFIGGQFEVLNHSQNEDSGPGMANDTITFMNNASFNSLAFETRSSRCLITPALPCVNLPFNHITANNLHVINPLVCGTSFKSSLCGYATTLQGAQTTWIYYTLQGDLWSHNTFWVPDSYPFSGPSVFYGNQVGSSFSTVNQEVMVDNLLLGNFQGDASAIGGGTIANFFTNSIFSHNALRAGTSSNYGSVGSGNLWDNASFPSNNAAIGYVNGTGTIAGDYHLAPTSPFSAANPSATLLSDDGTDLGADIDMIRMATSGAVPGTPSWDQQMGLRVDPGSSQAVFRYTAPTTDACVATIYRAPARISANQVASVADSSANSVSEGFVREIYINGLGSGTRYAYKLTCGGGVVLVGTFVTRPSLRQHLEFNLNWSAPTPVLYSSSRNMSSPVSLPPATRQVIPVNGDSVVYVQQGAGGPITMLIAP